MTPIEVLPIVMLTYLAMILRYQYYSVYSFNLLYPRIQLKRGTGKVGYGTLKFSTACLTAFFFLWIVDMYAPQLLGGYELIYLATILMLLGVAALLLDLALY